MTLWESRNIYSILSLAILHTQAESSISLKKLYSCEIDQESVKLPIKYQRKNYQDATHKLLV